MRGISSERIRIYNLLFDTMITHGVNADFLMKKIGIDSSKLSVNISWPIYEKNSIFNFWSTLEEITNDDHIGLHLGKSSRMMDGNIFDYFFLSAENFGAALKCGAPYFKILIDDVECRIEEIEGGVWVYFEANTVELKKSFHFFDFLFYNMLRFCKNIYGEEVSPTCIELEHLYLSSPMTIDKVRTLAFDCKTVGTTLANRMFFSNDALSRRSAYANAEIFAIHKRHADNLIASIAEAEFLLLVRRTIFIHMIDGEVCLESMTKSLGISGNDLRLRLVSLGTNFLSEREHCRWIMSSQMLKKSTTSIANIAFSTGYSELSTFYRAFKRWSHGETPAKYRSRHAFSHVDKVN